MVREVSLSHSPDSPQTFAEFRAGEGEGAAPRAAPRDAGPGPSGDLGRQGPSSEVAEETRGVGFLWGLGLRRPSGQTCPAQAAPMPALEGTGGGGEGREEGATGKARRGREEGGPGKREGRGERGRSEGAGEKEEGRKGASGSSWRRNGRKERVRGEGARGERRGAEQPLGWGALSRRAWQPQRSDPRGPSQLRAVCSSKLVGGRAGKWGGAGLWSNHPLRVPLSPACARGRSAPPAEPSFWQVPGRCPR